MKLSIAIALGIALVGASCARDPKSTDEPSPHGAHATMPGQPAMGSQVPGMADVEIPYERRQVSGVRTAVIREQNLTVKVRTVGLVVADERTVRKVQTKISGWVDRLYVNFTGQYVRANQPILSIYSPQLVATEREYLLALSASRTPSGIGEDEKKLLVDSARNRLRLWDLSDAQIREIEKSGTARRTMDLHSPIAGYVTLKPVYQGMYVTPEMELYTVSDLGNVWIWADVYENELDLVRVGQSALVSFAFAPGTNFKSVVSYVSPTMDVATRTVKVRLDVNNREGRLKPGMYATIELETLLSNRLALPDEAVIDTGERKLVFVRIGESTYQPREVRLGRHAGEYYEVIAGLQAGDRIVTSAQFLLDSESRLRAATGGAPSHGSH
jgi:membrane fusion protein, copper/silver efflux system